MFRIIPLMDRFSNEFLSGIHFLFFPRQKSQRFSPVGILVIITFHCLAVWSFQELTNETAKSALINSWRLPDVPFPGHLHYTLFRLYQLHCANKDF